eukprot:19910-Heterococcus_DN1.PRE.1
MCAVLQTVGVPVVPRTYFDPCCITEAHASSSSRSQHSSLWTLGCSANNQANNCCATQIKAKNTSCSYGNAPCMITGGAAPGPVSKGADPTCSAGKRHPTQSSVCCAASCGSACGATCVLFNSFTVPIHRVVSTTALRLLGLLQQLVC